MPNEGDQCEIARHELRIAQARATERDASVECSLKALSMAVQGPFQTTVQNRDAPPLALDLHRAAHRRGTRSTPDTDPERPAFLRARFHRLIFKQLAEAVAVRFPLGRRTSVSALHRWFRCQTTLPAKGDRAMTERLSAIQYPKPAAQVEPFVSVMGHDLAIAFLLQFGEVETCVR